MMTETAMLMLNGNNSNNKTKIKLNRIEPLGWGLATSESTNKCIKQKWQKRHFIIQLWNIPFIILPRVHWEWAVCIQFGLWAFLFGHCFPLLCNFFLSIIIFFPLIACKPLPISVISFACYSNNNGSTNQKRNMKKICQ